MTNPFISEIALFAFNFPPKGWSTCSGQLLSIAQNQALFSLLGTTYGGNGTTTFALPNLQSRVAVHFGQGVTQGEIGGVENVTLNLQTMPAHVHTIDISGLAMTQQVTDAAGNTRKPDGHVPAMESGAVTAIYGSPGNNEVMSGSAVAIGGGITAVVAGGSQPHPNLQPYLTLNYCIALQGIFPSRN